MPNTFTDLSVKVSSAGTVWAWTTRRPRDELSREEPTRKKVEAQSNRAKIKEELFK